MFVKPAEGRTVRRPDTFVLLAEAGEDVPRDEFWVRRLRDGDVVEAEAPGADDDAANTDGRDLASEESQS